MRWPGRIPPGMVSNEIIHEMDLFPTLARIVGGKVPDDRIIDGVDQLEFSPTGSRERSSRDSVIIYVGNDLFGVKWHNWKMMMKTFSKGFGEPVDSYTTPLLFDRPSTPRKNIQPIHA